MLEKVLIVEDSNLQAKMYQTVFKGHPDCRLIFAQNGLEALDQLALEKDFNLIILDINMPKMNGLAFLEVMRRNGYGKIPVIIVSTEGKDEDIRRGLVAGAKAYIKKPWKPDQLRDLLNKVVA
ncbi:MAG: response regulator [bacterium]|nr:response regulator [bacterium]